MANKTMINTNTEVIEVAKDFSENPGPRYKKLGKFSGEEFYESLLKPKFSKIWISDGILELNLDNTFPYPPSFISETFTQLTRDFKNKKKILRKLILISNDDPLLIDKITHVINETEITR